MNVTDKIFEWFKKDINEQLAWGNYDGVDEARVVEIAKNKTKNLIEYVYGGKSYEPFK